MRKLRPREIESPVEEIQMQVCAHPGAVLPPAEGLPTGVTAQSPDRA